MNSTIPLLGGVPFCGGEGALRFLMVILKKRERNIYKKMRSSRGKAPLRMTPTVTDEILTASEYEASG